ncbi:hypothetical protein CEXT_618781, partial [Caerostris extrusa]
MSMDGWIPRNAHSSSFLLNKMALRSSTRKARN